MKRLSWFVLPLLLGEAACTVSAVRAGSDPRPKNTCVSDADCGQNTHCGQGICQAVNGELEALFVAATPPSDSAIPHLTFVMHLGQVPSGGVKDLTLPGPSQIRGSLTLPKDAQCYPGFIADDPQHPIGPADDGKSLPVAVTLSLSQRLLGVPQQIYFANASTRNTLGGYTFDVLVPGGTYDVYLEPPKHQQGCAVPPQLYRSFSIETSNAEIAFPLSGVSTLPLAISWPKSSPSLTGWTVDLIEPLAGNPISTELVLGKPTDVGGSLLEYPASLVRSTVVQPTRTSSADGADSDLLRLRPPAKLVAPSIFMARSGLGVLQPPTERIVLTRFTTIPTRVQVEGRMQRLDSGEPVSGEVTLVSTEIYGVDAGIFGSYSTTVTVGGDGLIQVDLPPGAYSVQAIPPPPEGDASPSPAFGALVGNWVIPVEPPSQFGKVFDLQPTARLTGQSRFPGAQVHAVPSPQVVTPFQQAFGAGQFLPRAITGLVDDSGRFRLDSDPGIFDISVQAPEELGFAWFVRPGVQVGERDQDLGAVTLPPPSILSGTARVALAGGEASLGSGAIRAYAYLDKDMVHTRDPKQAVSVVQVAETRADEKGDFRLLVPSRIAASK